MNQAYEEIFNYLRISHRVETAGQPLKKEIQLIIKSGAEVVISLVPKGVNTEVPEEQQLFEQGGIVFKRIPVEWEAPQKDDFQAFLDKMAEYREKQLFIHCEANMRVSVFMALYHIVEKGWRIPGAMAGIREIWNPNDTWRAFFKETLLDYHIITLDDSGDIEWS